LYKGLKEFGNIVWGNANAGVGYRQFEVISAVLLFNASLKGDLAAGGRKLNGVAEQIDQHLSNAPFIDHYIWHGLNGL
jgi:hypothetical protein